MGRRFWSYKGPTQGERAMKGSKGFCGGKPGIREEAIGPASGSNMFKRGKKGWN